MKMETSGETKSETAPRGSMMKRPMIKRSMMKMLVSTYTLKKTLEIEKALEKNRDKKNVCILCGRYSVYVKEKYTTDKKYYSYQYICPSTQENCLVKKLKFTDCIPIIDDTTHSDIVHTDDEKEMREEAIKLGITPKYGEIFTESELKSYGYIDTALIKAEKVKKALEATAREKALEELSVKVSKKAEEAIAREKALEKALEKARKVKEYQEEELNAEVTRKVKEAQEREKARKVQEEQNKSLVSTSRRLNFDDKTALNSYKQKSIEKHKNFFNKYDKIGKISEKIQSSPTIQTVDKYDKFIEEYENIIPLSPIDRFLEVLDIIGTDKNWMNNPTVKKFTNTPAKTETKTKTRYRETGNAKESYIKLQMI